MICIYKENGNELKRAYRPCKWFGTLFLLGLNG